MPIEKIIVLEDDLIVRKNLEHQLRQRRYDVAGAATLAEAQEFLNKDNFDLMFVDVRLPDGDGTELLKGLQTRPLKPLVIITTGFGSIESAVECMRNGAFDYLIKPFPTIRSRLPCGRPKASPKSSRSTSTSATTTPRPKMNCSGSAGRWSICAS